MSESDRYKRRADELLRKAAAATDAAERAALVEQAARWHNLALETCNRDERRPAAPLHPGPPEGGR